MKFDLCLTQDILDEDEFRHWLLCSKQFLKKRNYQFHPLQKGEVISIEADILNHLKINPHYEGQAISILYEDDTFLVLDKPANLHVHPLSYEESDNCLSFLRSCRPSLDQVNLAHWDRGLLYRLDYGTSGVLFYVKKESIYRSLRENFSKIARVKRYVAVVQGLLAGEGELTDQLAPFGPGQKKMRVVAKEGQLGQLTFRSLQQNSVEQVSLIEVTLQTGLRHQIRAQLANKGFPILGDQLYGARPAERLFLHAKFYQVEELGVEAPLPEIFYSFFDQR